MSLRSCSDASAAAWITESDVPWHQLATFGPPGFDAYARLRFLPDPTINGLPEVILGEDASTELELVRTTLDALRQHTGTPDDVYFCVWDGWGSRSVPPDVLASPKVTIPHRSYFLMQGASSDLARWAPGERSPDRAQLHLAEPAFIWPADHAWCVAHDVDPHYAGIGASSAAVADLLAHRDLDVVQSDPRVEQPYYR